MTQDGWNVSCTTGYGVPGARLSVFRPRYHLSGKPLAFTACRGDWDGLLFPTSDAAWEFAYQHGYTQVYRDTICAAHRHAHRAFVADRHRAAMRMIAAAKTPAALYPKLDAIAGEIADRFGEILARTRFALGYQHAARALRPDLFIKPSIARAV